MNLVKSYNDISLSMDMHIFNLIRLNGPTTRLDILNTTGLKMSTLARVMNSLEKSDLITITETGESSGGRKPALYNINPHAGYIIGIDISRTYTRTALADLNGNIVKSQVFGMFADSTPETVIDKICLRISGFISEIGKDKFIGIGMGVVGPLDRKNGIILNPSNFPAAGWENIAIVKALEDRTGLPVYIENAANAAALGEYIFGSGKGFKNIAYIIAGIGLRLGINVNGKPANRLTSNEEAFGHIIIEKNGKPCTCGNRGCLEAYVSINSILENYKNQIKSGKYSVAAEKIDFDMSAFNLDLFCEAVQKDDDLALAIISETAEYFSLGLINVINILNPELIMLGGPLIRKCSKLYDEIINITADYQKRYPGIHPSFSSGSLGENAVIAGAACMVIDNWLHRKSHIMTGTRCED